MDEPKLEDMTLRDLMAMFAMMGLLNRNQNTDSTKSEREFNARDSYAQADAMLKERKKDGTS